MDDTVNRKSGHGNAGLRRCVRANEPRRSTRRALLIALGAGALAAPLASFAQQPAKVWRIGYLDLGSRQFSLDAGRQAAFLQGMRERGYAEGKHFVFEVRYADGHSDRLDGLAAELVRLKADIILTIGNPASHAAQRATTGIPIVVVAAADPVRDGFAESLARPGGNITGLSSGSGEIVQKWVELLITMAPKLSRVAVLLNPANSAHSHMQLSVQTALRRTGRQVLPVSARSPDDMERGFAAMARERADALIILPDSAFTSQRKQIAALTLKHQLPSMSQGLTFPEVGGLMAYGFEINDSLRQAATFVDKILKGAKPGDLPFEQPTRYYFVINRKTAKALGLTIPQELLLRADKVIE